MRILPLLSQEERERLKLRPITISGGAFWLSALFVLLAMTWAFSREEPGEYLLMPEYRKNLDYVYQRLADTDRQLARMQGGLMTLAQQQEVQQRLADLERKLSRIESK